MKVEISPEDVKRTSKAVDHFVAYLRSQQREDREFEQLAEFYRKMVKG